MNDSVDWLSRALEEPPDIHLIREVPRPAGTTPTYNIQEHWAINLYPVAGHIDMLDINQQFEFSAQSICLIPPNTERRFHFNKSCRQLVVSFAISTVENTHTQIPLLVQNFHRFPILEHAFDELIQLKRLQQSARARAALWHFLWQCHDIFITSSNSPNTHAAVSQAADYISLNLHRHPSATEISRAVGLSHNQLNRLFKEQFGYPLMQYCFRCRMQEAATLLNSSSESIKDIARSLGYDNLQLFNKQFRRYQKLSPSAYRRTYSNK